MRHTPKYLMTDPEEARRLIRQNPWGTFVSHTTEGLALVKLPNVDASAGAATIVAISLVDRRIRLPQTSAKYMHYVLRQISSSK